MPVETGEVHGEMHLGIGQEAVAAALAVLLRHGDAVVSTHRPHLHGLAHGVDPVAMLARAPRARWPVPRQGRPHAPVRT